LDGKGFEPANLESGATSPRPRPGEARSGWLATDSNAWTWNLGRCRPDRGRVEMRSGRIQIDHVREGGIWGNWAAAAGRNVARFERNERNDRNERNEPWPGPRVGSSRRNRFPTSVRKFSPVPRIR